MRKKDWYITIGALVGFIAVDQLFKWIATAVLGGKSYALGFVGFMVNQSSVAITGDFNLSQYIVIISSFGFSVLFLGLFFLLNFILTHRLLGFKIGMALFVAGMLGESMDFTFRGGVLDWFSLFDVNMNLTDLYVIFGILLTLFFGFKDRALLFRKDNMRKTMFTEKAQYVFCSHILCSHLLFTGAFFIFFLSFLQIIFNNFVRLDPIVKGNLITVFYILFTILSLCFLLIALAFMVYISNKVYGPVYAFRKYIKEVVMEGGEDRPFKLRKGDYFSDLIGLAEELKNRYRRKKE